MCGIVAQVGAGACQKRVVDGLSLLEYRGYDSAGVARISRATGQIETIKAAGKLSCLQKKLEGAHGESDVVIGHTRWATHGEATIENAHPHEDCEGRIAVVHNGIIEHCQNLSEKLRARGHRIISQTDTELVAHLFSELLRNNNNDLGAAARELLAELEGAYALVIMSQSHPDTLLVIRRRSPLAVGRAHACMMVASDQLAFPEDVDDVCFVPDNSYGIVSRDSVSLFTASGDPISLSFEKKHIPAHCSSKGDFAHYMLKEMYEQQHVIQKTVQFYQMIGGRDDATFSCSYAQRDSLWSFLGLNQDDISRLKKICIIAAGTSWHAGLIGKHYFEKVLGLETHVYLASEFRTMSFFPDTSALYLFITQSGETADTLEAVRRVQAEGLHTIALTNVASSSIVRMTDGFLLMHAGPEIAVASTKAFSCQLASLYWFAHRCALARGLITAERMRDCDEELLLAGALLQSGIERYEDVLSNELGPHLSASDRMIFLGRDIAYAFAREAALKLKEISYIFAQAYPAGELKHGPIALVDEHTPVVVFSNSDAQIYQKLLANVQEVKARKGRVIAFLFEGQSELENIVDHAFVFPRCSDLLAPLVMTGVMQYFAYAITHHLGLPIDKPRNLAKSVTVE